LNISEVTDKKG